MREAPFAPPSGPRFYEYFLRYKSTVVCYNMRKDIREGVGLGSPPSIYTTNASESMNAMIKRKVDYKQSEWPKFNEEMKQLVGQQREEIIRPLSGRGQYRLLPQFSHFAVSPSQWAKMRPEQRREVVEQFDKATVKSKASRPAQESRYAASVASASHSDVKTLEVRPEESGITKVSLITLQHMWDKAEDLLNTDRAITPAPGTATSAKMVLPYSSSVPHMVTNASNGQYKCDTSCLSWTSSEICSHTLVVSCHNGDLIAFLQWYNSVSKQPNITTLSMSGLPSGRGRKGGVPKRSRSRSISSKTPEFCSTRPALKSTDQHTAANTGRTGSLHMCSPTLSAHSSVAAQYNASPVSVFVTVAPSSQSVISPQHSISSPVAPSSQSVISPQHSISSPVTPLSQSVISPQHSITTFSPLVASTTQSEPSVIAAKRPTSTSQLNTNPFYVKFIKGNIRMCQGCRRPVKSMSGSIPSPPFDLVIARSERRSFHDKSGTLVTPLQEQTCHYHLSLQCVKAVEPHFVPFALKVPVDVAQG